MPFIIDKTPAQAVRERERTVTIYALCSPVGKEIYVWKTASKDLRNVYKNHYTLRNEKTKKMIQKVIDQGQLPLMYRLETVTGNVYKELDHCIVWAKYFTENGYQIIPMKGIETYTEQLSDGQTELYEEIKNLPIEVLFASDKNLFPNYGRERKREDKVPPVISVSVKPEEYRLVQAAAAEQSKSMAAFCRERILNGKTIKIDTSFIMEIQNELVEDRALLQQILFAICDRGLYLPADAQNLQRLMDDLKRLVKAATRDFNRSVREIKEPDLSPKQKKK